MSGKLADRATEAWSKAGLRRITLHECRHTYASFLMAAGYTLKELMEFMGHSELQMVQRYTSSSRSPRRPTRRSGSTPTSTVAAVADSLAEVDNALDFGSTSSARLTGPSRTRGWSQLSARGRFVAVRCGRTTRLRIRANRL